MKDILYYILSSAVSDRNLEVERIKDVTPEGWHEVYLMGKAQGVTALLFDKIKSIPKEVAPPKELVMQWISHAMSIEMQTKAMFEKSAEFAEMMAKKGIQTMVLKGLALSEYYSNIYYREYGDLDCYLYRQHDGKLVWDGCYEEGNSIAENEGYVVKRGFYKHSHIIYCGLEIENHQFALPIKDGLEVKCLERELRRCVATLDCLKQIGNTNLYRPSADFTALFLTAHSLSHFLFESIKLRHVLDWAFFVKAESRNVDWDNFWHWCERMHYTRFVQCLNYICINQLGLDVHAFPVNNDEETKRLSSRILKDIFEGESLYRKGYSGLRFRVALAFSYFKSMWKFRKVYQYSPLGLLMNRMKNYWVNDVKL